MYSRKGKKISVVKHFTTEFLEKKKKKKGMKFLNTLPVNFWKKNMAPAFPSPVCTAAFTRTDLYNVRPINHLQPWKLFLWPSGDCSVHCLACSTCLPARWATDLYPFHPGGMPVLMCLPPAWKLHMCCLASSNWEYSIASEHCVG